MMFKKSGSDSERSKISVRKSHKDVECLCKILKGDWVDLRVWGLKFKPKGMDTWINHDFGKNGSDMYMPSHGDIIMIDLGVAMDIPEGMEAHIVPRSSTFKNYGIIQTNSMGIIDNTYSGNDDVWSLPCYALLDGGGIAQHDRICQFRIVDRMGDVDFNYVDDLGNKNRGGFGSTGKQDITP